jgi:hypothetical protein
MRRWAEVERQRQAQLIQLWQSWKNSTGPTTKEGINKSKMNAYKHGEYGQEAKLQMAFLSRCKQVAKFLYNKPKKIEYQD